MTVRLVGGGGVWCLVLRIDGPGSGMMSVSSPPWAVLGGALTGGGGGASAGGKLTVRGCARALALKINAHTRAAACGFALAWRHASAKRQAARLNMVFI